MLTRPDPLLGVPAYLQLMEQVTHAVATGALQQGDVLPAAGRVAETLVISPNVVARAYRELERQGVIGAGRGVARRYPAIAGLDYAAFSRPALGVGGDYFDFVRLSDRSLAFAVGDVCGKGVPAALLLATLRSYVHAQRLRPDLNPSSVVPTLNRQVCHSFPGGRFATFFYAHYDTSTGTLDYVNAGHNPPLVFHAKGGEPQPLESGGPVLGILPDCSYTRGSATLAAGDVVLAYTDGITDAMNADGDEWGEARLTQAAAGQGARPARELVERIIGRADAFVAGMSQYDDMTLVALRAM